MAPRRVGAIALMLGVIALTIGWILAAPPGSAPDEAAHLIRAVSAARGEWHGRDAATHFDNRGPFAEYGRSFTVPSRLDVVDVQPCYSFKAAEPAICGPGLTRLPGSTAYSHVGAYYPLAYVPLGLAAEHTSSPDSAVYAARAVSAVLCVLLLLAGLMAMPTGLPRVGWLFAVTPLTLYTASSAATNGVEACGAIAFVAGCLGTARQAGDGRVGRAAGVAFVAGGIALASAKSAGPPFLAGLAALAALAAGGFAFVPRWGPRRAWAWGPPVLAAVGNLAWTLLAGRNHVLPPRLSYGDVASTAFYQAEKVPDHLFGAFGTLDVFNPGASAKFGVLAFAASLLVGAMRSDGRRRLVLALAVTGALGAAVLFAAVELVSGFGMQARYVLAIGAPLPLIAAFGARPAGRLGRLVLLPAVLITALLSGLSVYVDLRRYAVGTSGSWFLSHPAWQPPGGLVPPVVLAAAGGVLLAVGGLLSLFDDGLDDRGRGSGHAAAPAV